MSKDRMGDLIERDPATQTASGGEDRANDEMAVDTETPAIGDDDQTHKRFSTPDERNEQLIPGLPNEITLEVIAPMLPWGAFHTLCSVSTRWKEAIRSHQVYDARLRSHSTETFVVLGLLNTSDQNLLGLYSTRDKSCHQLPPLPGLDNGFSIASQCVSWDGKLYFIGPGKLNGGRGEMYVLDLAGQRQWKKCASMEAVWERSSCGVMDGKIYVFRGEFLCNHVIRSEVYDPSEDTWLSLTPMMSRRFDYQVASVGEKLVLYGGMYYDEEYFDIYPSHTLNVLDDPDTYMHDAEFLEIYLPVEDKWELMRPFDTHSGDTVFMAQGKFHRITSVGIEVHDMETNTWTLLQLNSFTFELMPRCGVLWPRCGVAVDGEITIMPQSILAVNGEILLTVSWFTNDSYPPTLGYGMLQSKGFGSESKEIVWETANPTLSPSLSFDADSLPSFMCSIEL